MQFGFIWIISVARRREMGLFLTQICIDSRSAAVQAAFAVFLPHRSRAIPAGSCAWISVNRLIPQPFSDEGEDFHG